MQRLETLQQWVYDIRQRLFDRAGPPFELGDDAKEWIDEQRSEDTDARVDKTERIVVRETRELVTRLNAVSSQVWKLREIITILKYRWRRSGEAKLYIVRDKRFPLKALQEAASDIAVATGFNEADVVAHILTGTWLSLPIAAMNITLRSKRMKATAQTDENDPRALWAVREEVSITLNTRDISQEQWRALYPRFRRAWMTDRFSERDERLIRAGRKLGLPPDPPPKGPRRGRGAVAYWEKLAKELNMRSWRAASVRYKRFSKKKDLSTLIRCREPA